jgi:SAM-dependent methyltransferase
MSETTATTKESLTKPSDRDFRFYDNRQKYLLFVNTTSEKLVVANQISRELEHLRPSPPALRMFDAGVGDGSVLTRVMQAAHHTFPHIPMYVVGKEISLEDVRLSLAKLSNRFFEHPATVVILTNLNYSDAPWLSIPDDGRTPIWHEVKLTGKNTHEFDRQIAELEPFLAEAWATGVNPKTGNPSYKHPVVLTIYREDHAFLLDSFLPRQANAKADYDLVIASQPFRARAPLDFKVKRVIAPLSRSLRPGGRLISIHSHGGDPAHEIVKKVWPGDSPFIHDRHMILGRLKQELGIDAKDFVLEAGPDNEALFRYDM